MSTRETKKITLGSGNVVEIYTYLTRGEYKEMQKAMVTGATIGEDGKPQYTAEALLKATDFTLGKILVSLDDSTENVAGRLNDLNALDVAALDTEVNVILMSFAKGGSQK